jgi:hypothetical protein
VLTLIALSLLNGVFTQSDIIARCHMARHTKIGSILFLSHDKFILYGTNSLMCVVLCKYVDLKWENKCLATVAYIGTKFQTSLQNKFLLSPLFKNLFSWPRPASIGKMKLQRAVFKWVLVPSGKNKCQAPVA